MAKLITPYLFTWQEVDANSDLERLRLVLDHIGDEGLMRKLEEHRKWGRDDYPIRAVWNLVLTGVVYQHVSVDSLRRELLRKEDCGGTDAVSIRAREPGQLRPREFTHGF